MRKGDRVQNWIGKQETKHGPNASRKREKKSLKWTLFPITLASTASAHAIEIGWIWSKKERGKNGKKTHCIVRTATPLTATTIIWTLDGCDADEEHLFSSSFYALDGSRILRKNRNASVERISHHDICAYFRVRFSCRSANLICLAIWPLCIVLVRKTTKCSHAHHLILGHRK